MEMHGRENLVIRVERVTQHGYAITPWGWQLHEN